MIRLIRILAGLRFPKRPSSFSRGEQLVTHKKMEGDVENGGGESATAKIGGDCLQVEGGSSEADYHIVNEGKASVLFPAAQSVFYNPVQEFNRDLTIAVMAAFMRLHAAEEAGLADEAALGRTRRRKISILRKRYAGREDDRIRRRTQSNCPDVTILEGLAATGLRSVRFALELPSWLPPAPSPLRPAMRVIANDVDPDAAALAQANIRRNGVDGVMTAACDDVVMLMLARIRDARKEERARLTKKPKRVGGGGGGGRSRGGDGNEEGEDEEEGVDRPIMDGNSCGGGSGAANGVDGGIGVDDGGDAEEEPFVDISDRLFQVIDLDPYGTAAPFLDSAVQALSDGGLLCVTCTDAAVLCGQTPETCFTKYGSVSLRSKFCHEQGIRIVLNCISAHASRHSKFIEPLISLSIDFYFRVFVRIHVGQAQAKLTYAKTAMVFNCSGCGTHSLQPLGNVERNGNSVKYLSSPVVAGVGDKCVHCDHRVHIGGPIWADKIHNVDFVSKVKELVLSPDTPELKTRDRIIGMLTLVEEELQDVPLYYSMAQGICGALRCFTPPAVKYRSAILNAGYRVSLSHAAEGSLKTDAPAHFIWDLMRAWVKEEAAVDPQRMGEGSVSQKILSVEAKTRIDFTPHDDAVKPSQLQGLKRFPPNPEAHWGPKARAKKRVIDSDSPDAEGAAAALEGKPKKPKRPKNPKVAVDTKQFPCKSLLAGDCQRGSDCRYSHDIDVDIAITVKKANID